MKYRTILIILFSLISFGASSQEAFLPVINYTTKEYGADFNTTNKAIVQDHRGLIYAANGFKLLEYDGTAWNSYSINKGGWILSLTVDSFGIIYAGSQEEFGLFAPDKQGRLKYQSLSDSLDIQDIEFSNVWKVHAFSWGIVFQAEEKLFIYRNGKIEIIKPETSFHTSFAVGNKLYVRQRGTGLLEMKNNRLEKIKGSEIFDTTGIFLMLPLSSDKKKILIGTQEKGFWLFEPERSSDPFHKFHIDEEQLIEKARITGGVLTGDGSIAVSTMFNGLIIIDTTGKTKTIINKKNGLYDNDVKQVMLDHSQNLWLAMENGISRIEISSPLTISNEKSGITGSINAIIRYNKLLYVGTTTGLYVQDANIDPETPYRQSFRVSTSVRSLIEAAGSLIAGTDAGIFQISGKSIKQIGNEESFTLAWSPELKILFSGGKKGLTSYFYNNNSFTKSRAFTIDVGDIIGISGKYYKEEVVSEFWLGTRFSKAIRIKVTKDLTFTSNIYDKADGLPDGPVTPYSLNSGTVFGTMPGLYGFTDENSLRESLPDSLKNNKDFYKGYFSEIVNNSIGKTVTFLYETGNKVWICSDNKVGYLDKMNKKAYVGKPFSGIEVGKIFVIYPEENGNCWIGTSDGLIRYNENIRKNYDEGYFSLIRNVNLPDNDSAIFLGTNFKTEAGSLNITDEQNQDFKPVFLYRNNSIRLEFSAPFYEYHEKIFYSYKLEGSNSRWSQWTKENFREYTNLHEGEYTFSVKARNVYGTESKPGQFSFVILPPWYRSSIAYILYAIIAIVLFWMVARIYSYRLKRENIRLEGIVTERTAEVVRQKDEIINKNTVLEYQKKEIEDSIRYARRIQSAVIPSEKDCVNLLTESFVFFKPLNIVSGDFYWISHVGNKIIFTAADCTGHGVPGAFMSMLGVAFLNEIVNKDHITEPDLILNQLREKVIQALQQQGLTGEARDGMDIAIICVDKAAKKLSFAGAYNPLIMIRNGEIVETAGDKMPIGIYENMPPFRRHNIDIDKGDVFYMSSDGYEDQFGGLVGKKFKSKQFKQLLLEIHKQPMEKQKEVLEKSFEEWKGDLPQVDDIVVVGLSIV